MRSPTQILEDISRANVRLKSLTHELARLHGEYELTAGMLGPREEAVNRAAAIFKVAPQSIVLRDRHPEVAYARFAAMTYMRRRGWRIPAIADAFQLTPKAVSYGLQAAQDFASIDPEYRRRLETLLAQIPGPAADPAAA